ncbi:MAG: hypothetical protein K0U74_15600 [Alphaproteobacteria bacterium]|nr:hypothetical protein [Alphaproteobacteria bacterium]
MEQLKSQFEKDGARYEHDARTVISIDAQRGDLRPIQVVANLSTEIDYFVFLADIFKDGRLPDSVARTMTAYMRKPEAERGEHRLLLRTTVRTERPLKEVTIKYFSIDWPFASDGADVLLTTVSASAHSAPNIDEKKYRFIRNSSNSTIEVGNIKLAFDDDSEGKNGRREFGIVLRFANAQMQADMPNLKMQMVLEMPGSILGITPVFADWSGKIVSKPGSKSKVEMKQSTSARLQIEVNTRHIFESQHYTFRYRLRLRGVEINSERMQYIKQILAERNLAVRAEGLGTSREEGRQVGTREWLVVAERPVQGDPLILTTLVQCETQEVLRLRGSDLDRFQGQDISANTVVDVLGVLRGRREDLMKEVNAYVRELRHQLGRFAGRG